MYLGIMVREGVVLEHIHLLRAVGAPRCDNHQRGDHQQ